MADAEDPVSVYDEVEIEDMTFDETLRLYHYPCPCGDRFEIALADLQDRETDIAVCPSCSLMIRVIYDLVRLSSLLSLGFPPFAPSRSRRAPRHCRSVPGRLRARRSPDRVVGVWRNGEAMA